MLQIGDVVSIQRSNGRIVKVQIEAISDGKYTVCWQEKDNLFIKSVNLTEIIKNESQSELTRNIPEAFENIQIIRPELEEGNINLLKNFIKRWCTINKLLILTIYILVASFFFLCIDHFVAYKKVNT
jgi:hypothetical protein